MTIAPKIPEMASGLEEEMRHFDPTVRGRRKIQKAPRLTSPGGLPMIKQLVHRSETIKKKCMF